MILEEFLEIVPKGGIIKYYRDLGYNVKSGISLKVKNEDVPKTSKILEKRKCDCCNREFTRKRARWEDSRKCYGKDVCVECSKELRIEKMKVTNKEKYGVDFPMQSKEIKQKAINTTLEKFGVEFALSNDEIRNKGRENFKNKYHAENVLQVPEFLEKTKRTNMERYGKENVFAVDKIKEKIKETLINKYGEDNVSKVEEIKQKKIETCLENFGVEHPLQNEELRIKARQTMTKNGTTKLSKPQKELYNLCLKLFPNYKVELNYPLGPLSLDIFIGVSDDIKIDLEYDGWHWHRNNGQKDYARDCVVKKNGYKVIRIRSAGLLPSEEELVNSINYVIENDYNFLRITLDDWNMYEENFKNKNKEQKQ